jgi:hypothetical protein
MRTTIGARSNARCGAAGFDPELEGGLHEIRRVGVFAQAAITVEEADDAATVDEQDAPQAGRRLVTYRTASVRGSSGFIQSRESMSSVAMMLATR